MCKESAHNKVINKALHRLLLERDDPQQITFLIPGEAARGPAGAGDKRMAKPSVRDLVQVDLLTCA